MLPDLQVWDLMELELAIPILVVTMSQGRRNSRAHDRRTFFAKARHLEQFLGVDKATVDRVDLFTPSHMNGADSWRLEPLLELWRCVEPAQTEMTSWLFKVASSVYVDSCLGTDPRLLQRESCVYSAAQGTSPMPPKARRRPSR